ncbi:PREDICTED: probable apyrase 3 [Camelina sativa]|uniref:apyrase n=1 Tax=Camelina sativa TaxID=90675 RepID=A0ABM0YM28_CAMSA|nr:PREDICTED: probable apyrase 3 [Camelina sativa]
MEPEMDALKVPILPDEHQSSSPTPWSSRLTKRIIIPTAVSGALALGIFSFFLNFNPAPVPLSGSLYSVIIDAGSSGSRVHVFKYSIDQSGAPVFSFAPDNHKVSRFRDGLSTYANNLEGAKEKVEELVDFAKEIVPQDMWSRTDIRLMATAGMRAIAETDQESILNIAKQVFRSRPGFHFRDEWAYIVSGSDEGLYAWIIANHALGLLGNTGTTGIVELGGASAQVTFELSNQQVNSLDSHTKTCNSFPYRIYSHSFPNYGKDAALKRLMDNLQYSGGEEDVEDPCTPQGYTYQNNRRKYLSVFLADESEYTRLVAAGNFARCKIKTLELLQEGSEMCPSNSCAIGSTYTPPVQGRFLATSNFAYTSEFFHLDEQNWMSDLRQKGEAFCQKTWEALKVKYRRTPHYSEEYLRGYCFSSAYIIAMLERLGFNDESTIEFSNEVHGTSLDWASGAFIDSFSQPSIAPAPSPALTSGDSRKFLGF